MTERGRKRLSFLRFGTRDAAPLAASVDAPAPGTVLPLADVPDPVFASGAVGPGFAVDITSGTIGAPVAGTVVLVADTLHAVGIRAANGAEVLVHVGIDSMKLRGEGFTALCAAGDDVEAGQPILEVDLDVLRGRVPSTITPVVVSNAAAFDLEGPALDAPDARGILVVRGR